MISSKALTRNRQFLKLKEEHGSAIGTQQHIKKTKWNLWFDDDGTVFLRKSGEDNYEARYGGYLENFIIPTGHGVLKNLAV